ncbi:MAG: pyridoxamine 5'-phosphate oxidase family protein [Reyranellaceae bacterium]
MPTSFQPSPAATAFLPPHADELRARALARVATGTAAVRALMPDQHRDFFRQLPLVFVGAADGRGWPIATVLHGAPGFIGSPAPDTLRIAALPGGDDPAGDGLRAGGEIGLLGLDLATRRRNRANGRLVAVDDGLTVRVSQSFGNCPQYIQRRTVQPASRDPGRVERLDRLDDEARVVIAGADTFFVASRSRAEAGPQGGFDISHRGGRPGFVGVQGGTLAVPDFRGNRYFNTLGNLLGDDRAGLLFVDFATGDALQVQGRVAIDWQPTGGPAGAERLWRIEVEQAWRRRRALPFAWAFVDYAPTTLASGAW